MLLDKTRPASIDNVITIPTELLGRIVGLLNQEQEALLARAVVVAYDLDIDVMGG